jgi:hypothetical protein
MLSDPGASEPLSESPSAETTATRKWRLYTSRDRGYSVEYPGDWTPRPATQDWPAGGFSYPDDPAVDKWTPAAMGDSWTLMFVAEQPLKPGETARERMQRFDGDNATACTLSPPHEVNVDGEQGRR